MTALKQLNILKSLETLKDFHRELPASTDEIFNKKKADAEKALSHLSTLFETTAAINPRLAAYVGKRAGKDEPPDCDDGSSSDGAPHHMTPAAYVDKRADKDAPPDCDDGSSSDGAPHMTRL